MSVSAARIVASTDAASPASTAVARLDGERASPGPRDGRRSSRMEAAQDQEERRADRQPRHDGDANERQGDPGRQPTGHRRSAGGVGRASAPAGASVPAWHRGPGRQTTRVGPARAAAGRAGSPRRGPSRSAARRRRASCAPRRRGRRPSGSRPGSRCPRRPRAGASRVSTTPGSRARAASRSNSRDAQVELPVADGGLAPARVDPQRAHLDRAGRRATMTSVRRRIALTRATSARGLNGLVT